MEAEPVQIITHTEDNQTSVLHTCEEPTVTDQLLKKYSHDGGRFVQAVAKEAKVGLKPNSVLEEMLVDQISTAHALVISLMAKSSHFLDFVQSWDSKGRQQVSSIEAARLAGSAARLMDSIQKGTLALDKLRNDGKQIITVQHVEVKGGGKAIVTGGIHAAGIIHEQEGYGRK